MMNIDAARFLLTSPPRLACRRGGHPDRGRHREDRLPAPRAAPAHTLPLPGAQVLLRVFDKHKNEMEHGDDARGAKVLTMLDLYFCSSECCGIGAAHKSGLSSCAGKYDKDRKPSCCGK